MGGGEVSEHEFNIHIENVDGLKKFSYVEEGRQIINSRVINSVISGNAYIRDIHVRGVLY